MGSDGSVALVAATRVLQNAESVLTMAARERQQRAEIGPRHVGVTGLEKSDSSRPSKAW